MLAPEELQELESTVENLYEHGNSENQQEIMETWFKDIDYFPKTRYIIELSIPNKSDSKVKLAHFGLRASFLLLQHICPTWSLDDFMEMAKWCRDIFMSQIERFISVPLLMQAFCNMYSQLVLYGWHISDGFEIFAQIFNFEPGNKSDITSKQNQEQFWTQLLSSSPLQWVGKIRIYTEIVAKMTYIHKLETKQVKEFKEVALYQCFYLGVHTLDLILDKKMPEQYTEDDIFQLIDQSVQLINTCLCFDIDSTQHDDFNSLKILLPEIWAANNNFTKIIDNLFQMYSFTPPSIQNNILMVIFLFSSVKSGVDSLVINDKLDYSNTFFVNLTKIIDSNIEKIIQSRDILQLIVNIILKIFSFTIEPRFKSIPSIPTFPNFINSVYMLTKAVFTIEIMVDAPDIIISVLCLWAIIAEIVKKCTHVYFQRTKDSNRILEQINFDLDQIDPDAIQGFATSLKQMVSDVIETYVNFISKDAVEKLIEAFISEESTERMQMEQLLTYVVEIGKVTGVPFYESLLKSYNDLLQAYMSDQSNIHAELQLCTFAMMISPLVITKVTRSDDTFKLVHAHSLGFSHPFQSDFSSEDKLSKAAIFNRGRPNSDEDEFGDEQIDESSIAMFDNLSFIHDQSVVGILYLLLETNSSTEPCENEHRVLEEMVLHILGKFIKSVSINKNPFTLPEAIQQQFNVKTTNDLYPKFIKRITRAIITFPQNRHIISLAMNVMSEWAKAIINSMSHYLTSSDCNTKGEENEPFLNVLYDIYHSNLAEFFETTEHIKHIRVQFFQIIGQIFDSIPDKQIMMPLLESMEKRYELAVENKDVHLLQGVISDLRGILRGINEKPQAYSIMFSFIYPKLQTFHEATLSSNLLVFPYLKFLNELTNEKKSRIKFPSKSADGLRLAKAAMFFTIAFFENAPKSLDNSSKGLYYSMKIMKNVFISSYSDLGAIIAYDDPILIQLFTSFLAFAQAADFKEIAKYPKNLKQIIKLMGCLFPDFTEYIVNIDISFLQTALIICAYTPNKETLITIAFKVIDRITDFCVSLLETSKGAEIYENMSDTYNKLLTVLEELILKMPFSMSFHESIFLYEQLIQCTKNVLRIGPTNWPEVKQRLQVFLKSPSNQEVRGLIDDLVLIE